MGKPFPFYMPRTKDGIYHNILESDYPFTIGEITFYFSSHSYRRKFMDRYRAEIMRFNESAMNIYKRQFNLVFIELAVIRLYTMIEKRGFYIILRGEPITCLENLTFHLVTNVEPNSLESIEI
jgi:hypothetical protein